ncbi:MAG: PH domain-containing protein [Anaerolineales bacterium]|nr:PH domain-containing protein [Anaerolineales bacterium]MCX7754848.1 PH domain-containing protein [Anaerolineales bacterium]MDW8278724.1 PH domain-containing protein [Anaerolineales bacterium]
MSEPQTFTPELLPRQGERNAWLLALAATIGLLLIRTWAIVPTWVWVFIGFLYFSALSISLGNWMDRRTRLTLSPEGVAYENGLRHARLMWEDIEQVRVSPARWGRRVEVIGKRAHFSFETLGEVHFRGQVRGYTGFAQGEAILNSILETAGLRQTIRQDALTIYTRS